MSVEKIFNSSPMGKTMHSAETLCCTAFQRKARETQADSAFQRITLKEEAYPKVIR